MLKVERGAPVLLRDVARIEMGPDERRGLTELNGEGEVVSGMEFVDKLKKGEPPSNPDKILKMQVAADVK